MKYPDVIIYGKDTCGFCHLAKDKFKNQNMMYFNNIEKSDNISYLQKKLNYPYFPMIFFKTTQNKYEFKGGWTDVKNEF